MSNNIYTTARLAAAILITAEEHFSVRSDSVLVNAFVEHLRQVSESPLLDVILEYSGKLDHEALRSATALHDAIAASSGLVDFVEKCLKLSMIIGGGVNEFYGALDLLVPDHPQKEADVSYGGTETPVQQAVETVSAEEPPRTPGCDLTALGGDTWLTTGQYVNGKGDSENIQEGGPSLSPDGAVAACLFTAVKAIRLNELEVATGILAMLPNQIAQMLRAVSATTAANIKEDSAKKLTEEWSSTLDNIDQLFPSGDAASEVKNLLGNTIRDMASVKAGFYPPLSTLIQTLNMALMKEGVIAVEKKDPAKTTTRKTTK